MVQKAATLLKLFQISKCCDICVICMGFHILELSMWIRYQFMGIGQQELVNPLFPTLRWSGFGCWDQICLFPKIFIFKFDLFSLFSQFSYWGLLPQLLRTSYFNKALTRFGLGMKIVTLPSFCILMFHLWFLVPTWIYENR